MKQKHISFFFFIPLLLSCLLLLLSCSDSNVVTVAEEVTPVFFPIKENFRWKMQKGDRDTAYFQTGTMDTFSFAKVFWDTVASNRINVSAIPIEFVYWEQNFKKRQYFALGITDSGYIFAMRTNPMIEPTESYPLNFYSTYFFIPNKSDANNFIEQIGDTLIYGTTRYTVSTVTRWNSSEQIFWEGEIQKKWEVTYMSERQTIQPKTYIKELQFLENIGFYKYNNYELVSTYQLE